MPPREAQGSGPEGLALGWPWVEGTRVGTSRRGRGLLARLVTCSPCTLLPAEPPVSSPTPRVSSWDTFPAHPAAPPAGHLLHGCLRPLSCPCSPSTLRWSLGMEGALLVPKGGDPRSPRGKMGPMPKYVEKKADSEWITDGVGINGTRRPESPAQVPDLGVSLSAGVNMGPPKPVPPRPFPARLLQLLPPGDHLQHLRVWGLPTAHHPAGDHHHPAHGGHPAVRVAGLHDPQSAAHGVGPQGLGALGPSGQELRKVLWAFTMQGLRMH